MNRRNSNMGRIRRGSLWQSKRGFQVNREIGNLFRKVEDRKTLESRQSFAGSLRIASRGLIQHELGDVDVKTDPTGLPPFPGHLLVAGTDQIPTWPSCEVAWHGGF